MAFVRVKRIRGREYAYLVASRWDPKRKASRQVTLKYLGPAGDVTIEDVPKEYRTHRVRTFLRRRAMRGASQRAREVAALRDRLLRAILDGDRDATTDTMNAGLEAFDLDGLYLDVVAPAMRAVGDLWEDGAIPVSQEHLASNLVAQHLDHFNAAVRLVRPPHGTAAVCTAPGEEHSLSGKVLEGLLTRRGYRPMNVSASAPLDSIVGFLESRRPDVVLISVTMEEHLPSARRLAAAVRKRLPSAQVLVGGQAAPRAKPRDFPSTTLVAPERTLEALDALPVRH